MTTALITHPLFAEHDNGPNHPEQIGRLHSVLSALQAPAFSSLNRRQATRASQEQVRAVHTAAHLRFLEDNAPAAGDPPIMLDEDTPMMDKSLEAAYYAAGAACQAVDLVIGGETTNAFCALRPPGHHAEPHRPMGFCLFNNVAIGAAHALNTHKLERVAILDFDVHHGNGTQAWAEGEPKTLFLSTHEWPQYPGTGAANERGKFGNIVNVPLAPGTGSAELEAAWRWHLLPALTNFQPQMIFISAGFDAHKNDPLAGLQWASSDYGWITQEILKVAEQFSQKRVVSVLEGGYNLEALAESVTSHVQALLAA